MPGMLQGKPAGVRCVQLDAQQRCRIFGRPDRPAVCNSLMPAPEMCGTSQEQALTWLDQLEFRTTPGTPPWTPPAPTA
ncbi:MAG: YkgJ family cysteine cluster protein [Rhodocyclaceae bacterium]|nr:YkgJ family cysteine cluster protein [Rhodocyclaceae bacterium]